MEVKIETIEIKDKMVISPVSVVKIISTLQLVILSPNEFYLNLIVD